MVYTSNFSRKTGSHTSQPEVKEQEKRQKIQELENNQDLLESIKSRFEKYIQGNRKGVPFVNNPGS